MHCSLSTIRSLLRDYDKIQFFAVLLIYMQIGCALIGSLGAFYNGVLLINLVVALFALIAIESNSQGLGRTYAVLLGCGILLDVVWFILFSHAAWNVSSEKYGPLLIFSVRLALSMQIIGFAVRLLSSLLWIQMYRLGASSVDSTIYRYADFDLRNSLLSPSSQVPARQNSGSEDILGGSIYDPACYSSVFEDVKDNRYAYGVDNQIFGDDGKSTSAPGTSPLKLCNNISSPVINTLVPTMLGSGHVDSVEGPSANGRLPSGMGDFPVPSWAADPCGSLEGPNHVAPREEGESTVSTP